ncbi:MAG: DUF3473 domain-containing protein, partial [Phycisphaerales bacterium]
GHEIASHGYAHVLAYEVGAKVFQQDITKAKDILEDLTGKPVRGFRAPGFGITKETPWAFDVIKESGYEYDSSVFPASRGHGGILGWPLGPHFIETQSGHLLEIPMSVVEIFGHRLSLFGGGYLRLASKLFINWGIGRLLARELPLVVYVHPREIDPDQPRLSLSRLRRFKCYVNLETTRPKLEWLCEAYSFHSMLDMVESYIKSSYFERRALPVVSPMGGYVEGEASPAVSRQTIRHGLLQVEKTMASFLKPEILGPESGGIDSQPLSANR